MIYQELILDSSIASHSDTVQRNLPMLIGSERLVANLRHLNPGRPWDKYDVFFTHMKAFIEESFVAADDRRHGASQMSQRVSIENLIKKTSA